MERSTPKVIKRPKVVGNIEEIKATEVIKRPEVFGIIEEPKANRVIKIPKVVKADVKRKRFVNPITLSYVLRPTYLAALGKIEKRDEEWQQKLKTFKEISQKIEKKINNQKPVQLKNDTKSFGIKIINKNGPLIHLNSTIDSVASLLKKQLNEMKRIKHFETLRLTFKKTTVDADKNEPKTIFKSKAKTTINENEINEGIQASDQEILNGMAVWLSEGSRWTVESINDQL